MQAADRPDISARFDDDKGMERAMARGVREALRRHKLLGESIVVGVNGKIVEIPAEEIELPGVEDEEQAADRRG